MCRILFSLLIVGAISAHATVLNHEDFSAYANDGVTQLDDDIPSPVVPGYAGDWVHASTSWGTGDIVSQPGGFVSGNDGFSQSTSGRVARQLEASLSATSNTVGTLYLGWLFKVNGTNGVVYEMLALYDGIGNTDSDAARNFDAGVTENGALGGDQYGFGADNNYTGTTVPLDTSWHLLVARFELSSNALSDSVTFWVDPASEGDPSHTASGLDLTWDTLTISDYDEFTGSWDDIVWGTTFADVLSPIPSDPPTFAAWGPEGGTPDTTPTITTEIIDGDSPVNTSSIAMYLDDVLVSHGLTQSPDTTTNYVSYAVPAPMELGSRHSVRVVADDEDPTIAPLTNSWEFFVATEGFGLHIYGTNAPNPGIHDVYQFEAPDMDWDNIGGVVSTNASTGQNDASTYVANDRTTQGQLFTTGSNAPSYELSSVWVKHVLYTNDLPGGNGTWASLQTGNAVTIRIVDPSKTNTAGFVIQGEELPVVVGSLSSAGGNGTGNWMEYRLSVPVSLDANTQYGFDLTSYGPWFELAGMGSNEWYAGGDAYTTASKEDLNMGTAHPAADRTFLVELSPELTITSIEPQGADLVVRWLSDNGETYSLSEATQLDPGDWTVTVSNLPATPPENAYTNPGPLGAQGFVRVEVEEKEVLLDDDFESGAPGWTQVSTNTQWELGVPSVGVVGGPAEARSTNNCWGTDLDAGYANSTDARLRSPVVDLTGVTKATLSFWQYVDTEAPLPPDHYDYGTVRVIDTNSPPNVLETLLTPIDGLRDVWEPVSLLLPGFVLGQPVRIEFQFITDDYVDAYAGWYIDDVTIAQ